MSHRSPYDERFYISQHIGSRRSAEAVLPLVLSLVDVSSIVDVGCGAGVWLSTAKRLGVPIVLGIDHPDADSTLRELEPQDFLALDLENGTAIDRHFDLALCLEVAEHLPASKAPDLVHLLCGLAPVVLFSAAVPAQGGTNHLNEQWPAYWEELFCRNGYTCFDIIRPIVWLNASIEPWYRQNVLLMCDRATSANLRHKRSGPLPVSPSSVVHPDLFVTRVTHLERQLADAQRTVTDSADGHLMQGLRSALEAKEAQLQSCLTRIGGIEEELRENRVAADDATQRAAATHAALQEKIESLAGALTEVRGDGERTRSRVAALTEELAAEQSRYAAIERRLARSHEAIRQLSADVAERDAAITALNHLVRSQRVEAEAARSALASTLASTSWRVTAPVRWVKDTGFLLPLRRIAGMSHIRRLALAMPLGSRRREWAKRLARRVGMLPSNDLRRWVAGHVPPTQVLTRLRILFVNDRIPTPDKNSHSVRIYAILTALRTLGYDVSFLSFRDKSHYHWILGPDESLDKYEKAMSELGITDLSYGYHESREWLSRIGPELDYVFVSYPDIALEMLPMARFFAPHASFLYDTTDLHWVRYERQAKLGDPSAHAQAEHYRQVEHFLFRNADAVLAVTEEERKVIDGLGYGVPSFVIPNVHTTVSSLAPFEGRQHLMFVGHYLHKPNEDAVVHYAEEVLPLLRDRLPGVDFLAIGSGITDVVRRLKRPGLVPVGFVEDLEQYYRTCRVFVAPLRFGAGMKGKIGESLGQGLPVVTSPIGAEGMGLVDGVHCLIRDDPRSFADAVVELYTNAALWRSVSRSGLQHVRELYSPDAARDRIKTMLSVVRPPRQIEGVVG